MVIRLKTSQVSGVKAKLLAKQEFKCGICPLEITVSEACLDHDHSTGFIRGVLCRNCNGLEGKFKTLAIRGRRGMPHAEYVKRVAEYWIEHAVPKYPVMYPTHKTDDEKRVIRNKKARVARAGKKAVKKK